MARLSDLYAVSWKHQLDGVTRTMRPLSLATFAELEGMGLQLTDLKKPSNLDGWIKLYCFLADTPGREDEIRKAFLSAPLDVRVFQQKLEESFSEAKDQVRSRHRKAVNPLDAKREEEEGESTDMSFLVTLARMSGIPLSDLFRMTFRGLGAVQASLEDLPPQPNLGGLA